ncbi:MAG: DNA-directed RNA polymerase subunit omega [Lactobacillales bacterium]|jgi:DNA-directed RNA polymerase subunit omega|nr:DNA-directed RNA polymerase subunit omega [Lactobacillales bacterium]
MLLNPSIDRLLEKVNSKYSLVILASKRAHEIKEEELQRKIDENERNGLLNKAKLRFPTHKIERKERVISRALEEIVEGKVTSHQDPELKRAVVRLEEEARDKHLLELHKQLQEKAREETERAKTLERQNKQKRLELEEAQLNLANMAAILSDDNFDDLTVDEA